MVSQDGKVDYFASSLFLLIIIKSGLLAGIRWSVCISKSHRSLCESFSRTVAGLCIYHLLVWSNLNFLHISEWITLPTQSCLALYSLCANYYHYYYLLIRVFHISISWWSFIGDWVTASLLKSPGLFSVFWPFFNNAVWMVSTRLPISKSSRPFNNPLVTVPKVPITIGIIVTFMFHSFFNSLARSRYLSLFSHSFSFILWSAGTAKSTILQIFFFFFVDYYKFRFSFFIF